MFKIGFCGTSELSYIFLQALLDDARFSVPFVITKYDLNKRRSGLLELLSNRDLNIYTQNIVDIDPNIYKELDCVLVVAYGEKIPAELLIKNRWINVHGSILPQLRGASPIQYAIALGFESTGLTLTVMNERIDSGPIISTISHKIDQEDTFGTLSRRIGYDSLEWLKTSLIDFLKGMIMPRNQDGVVTKAPIIKKEWTVLDWNQSAEVIDRKIRALNPAPLALTKVHDIDCKVVEGCLQDKDSIFKLGEMMSSTQLIFQTTTRPFRITRLIPAGRKLMTDEEFLRGLKKSA